jgi:DHA1 family bicyclomycin/chloramphenicol resistance-like MFS transporter
MLFPNATALALSRHRDRAGTASALLGLAQYAIGAAAGPVAGFGGLDATAMAAAMFAAACLALIVFGTAVHGLDAVPT